MDRLRCLRVIDRTQLPVQLASRWAKAPVPVVSPPLKHLFSSSFRSSRQAIPEAAHHKLPFEARRRDGSPCSLEFSLPLHRPMRRALSATASHMRSPSASAVTPLQRLSLISRHLDNRPLLEINSPYSTQRNSQPNDDVEYTPYERKTSPIPDVKQQTDAIMSTQADHPALLIPGPVEFDDAVLQSMGHYRYVICHRMQSSWCITINLFSFAFLACISTHDLFSRTHHTLAQTANPITVSRTSVDRSSNASAKL